MIFHLPFKLVVDVPSGSVLRPLKMIQAFRNIGYDVDMIMGTGQERKELIAKIKARIRQGIPYDFLYSESSNLPTLLTEDNRVPSYPLMDFDFFRYCRSYKIKIGLFYRDIYWKFRAFRKNVPLVKMLLAYPFYEYDICRYKQLVNILYLPSLPMANYIHYSGRLDALPPGIGASCGKDIDDIPDHPESALQLNIFYVGGLKDFYKSERLFETVGRNDNLTLTFCCREEEWAEDRKKYMQYENPRIRVIHKSGRDLIPHYKVADICSLFLEPTEYRAFAMPFKLFEYLGFRKPVIATSGTAAGDFVKRNDVGWHIDYSVGSLELCLRGIANDKDILAQKRENIDRILPAHTWEARAEKVARDLGKDSSP